MIRMPPRTTHGPVPRRGRVAARGWPQDASYGHLRTSSSSCGSHRRRQPHSSSSAPGAVEVTGGRDGDVVGAGDLPRWCQACSPRTPGPGSRDQLLTFQWNPTCFLAAGFRVFFYLISISLVQNSFGEESSSS